MTPFYGGSMPAADVSIDARNTGADGIPPALVGENGHVELAQVEPQSPKI
jgi:hypothetical protein